MSLVECMIRQKGSGVVLDFEGHEIAVGAKAAKVLAASKEQKVLAGFRPNHVEIDATKTAGSIAGTIYARQLLGGEILAEAKEVKQQLASELESCRVDAHAWTVQAKEAEAEAETNAEINCLGVS